MSNLEVRRLGRTEMKPKALGLGCGHIGFPDQTDEAAISLIRRAIDQGIDFVDTSPYYGLSENRVGRALAGGWRERVYLQTKVGSHPRFLRDFSKEATTWSLENSLRELQTEYIDSVLIHGPRYDIEEPLGECLDVLLEWKAKGRIGHTGIGVRQHEFHRVSIETGKIDIILSFLDYTLLAQSVAKTTIPLAIENDVGIILGSPLHASLLAGPEPVIHLDRSQYSDTTIKEDIPAMKGGPSDRVTVLQAYKMWLWCQEREFNIRDLAIQFALNAPVEGNGIALCGPANIEEFDQIYTSATKKIPEAIWQDFDTEFHIGI